MTIILEQHHIPVKGKVNLEINRSFEIKLTAEEAQRLVNRWLLDQVSYMPHAELPDLVIGKRIVWRVPAVLTATHVGRVGVAGSLDVDVFTGIMANDKEVKDALVNRAEILAASLPPYIANHLVAEQFIPQHLPQTAIIEAVNE